MDAKKEKPISEQCRGACLYQTGLDCVTYYRAKECEENCQLVKCPNWLLCGQANPQQIFDCHGDRCIYCNQSWGCNLTFNSEKKECPICLEDKPLFISWKCVHELCVECFRKNYGWTDSFLSGPSEEKEPRILTLEEYLPLAEEQERFYDELDKNRVVILDSEGNEVESPREEKPKYIGLCPICRHKGVPSWLKSMQDKEKHF